jgi:hypothetical protein
MKRGVEADQALEKLHRGEASLVKCMRHGRSEMIVRSEAEGSAWEAKITSGLVHFFEKFFRENGNHDGLFSETHQTASIKK